MKKIFYLFTFLLIGFSACQTSSIEDHFETTITGYLDNIAGTEIILAEQTPEGIIPIDTTTVLEDGYFVFTTEVGDMQLYRIVLGLNQFITVALQKGDHIHIEADGQDVTGYYVEGSKESILISDVSKQISRNRFVQDSLAIEIKHLTSAKNGKELYRVFELQKITYAQQRSYSINFIKEHPGSIAAYFLVTKLQLEEDSDSYFLVQQELNKTHPTFNFLPTLNERIGILNAAKVGTVAPELAYRNPTGEIIALSSLRGKYVLLDFWASWCKPCRAENPKIKKLYTKYNDQGFEIYGYSLDQDDEKWKQAIIDDQLDWIQTSDLQGWKAEGSKLYGVQAIPSNVIIDPDGIIIARNLHGNDLEDKLADIFGN